MWRKWPVLGPIVEDSWEAIDVEAGTLGVGERIDARYKGNGKMRFQEDELRRICDRLIEYDPEIVEIIQFGSSVYAPEMAKDLDILAFTRKKRDYFGYLDAIDELDLSYDVDVVVKETDEKPDRSFIVGVFGAHRVLYGDGICLQRCFSLIDPTYEEAKAELENSRSIFRLGLETEESLRRDLFFRDAFNGLFHASRLAAMTYLSSEEGRWGRLRKDLPQPHRGEFEEFIEKLHIDYFYNGNYPKDEVEREFERWAERVRRFIRELEGKR